MPGLTPAEQQQQQQLGVPGDGRGYHVRRCARDVVRGPRTRSSGHTRNSWSEDSTPCGTEVRGEQRTCVHEYVCRATTIEGDDDDDDDDDRATCAVWPCRTATERTVTRRGCVASTAGIGVVQENVMG